jgi:uncharacterized protein
MTITSEGVRSAHRIPGIWFVLLVSVATLCCSEGHRAGSRARETAASAGGPDEATLRARTEKDENFRRGSNSPLPEADRARFAGLAYYPPNPQFRYDVKLVRYARPEKLRLGTNTGEMRDALRYGYFEFDVRGRTCRLQVYRTLEDINSGGTSLFVPFRDATSGKETYAAGRYLELRENTTGQYSLDFNRAFNPYCAYGKSFSCPVPPAENALPVAIEAGEKSYNPQSVGSRQ